MTASRSPASCSATRFLPALLVTALAFSAGSLAAQDERQEPPPVIRVSASGTVDAQPDRVRLILAVETRADSAREAAEMNARRSQAVLEALRRLGISDQAVRTTGYQLQPVYERPPRPDPEGTRPLRLVGYRAMNSVQATVDSLPLVGRVIDAGIAAGANRLAGLNFEVRDEAPHRRQALTQAVESARARAETAAAAAGARLGPVVEIHLVEAAIPFRGRMAVPEAAMDMAVETPVEPGILSLTETVSVVWRLEQD